MVRRRSNSRPAQTVDPDFSGALEAMSAPEWRSLVHAVLNELEDEQRARVVDSLVARAARGDAGWKPNRPSPRIVSDAKLFADAARGWMRRPQRGE